MLCLYKLLVVAVPGHCWLGSTSLSKPHKRPRVQSNWNRNPRSTVQRQALRNSEPYSSTSFTTISSIAGQVNPHERGMRTASDDDVKSDGSPAQQADQTSASSAPSRPRFMETSESPHVRLAYHYFDPPDAPVCVLFCNGFLSSMDGQKALFLQQFCQLHNPPLAYCRFDYRCHGQSSIGVPTKKWTSRKLSQHRDDDEWMEHATLGNWIQDTLHILDQVVLGAPSSQNHASHRRRPVILVGSSMGAWIVLHVALARRDVVSGMVGISSAPDFTETIRTNFTTEQLTYLQQHGVVYLSSQYDLNQPYPITQRLLDEAKENWLVLSSSTQKSQFQLTCPIRLFHGMQDVDVDWATSLQLINAIQSTKNVQLTLIKDGDHRLSRSSDLQLLARVLQNLVVDLTVPSL